MGLLINRDTLLIHIPKTGGTTFVQNFKTTYGHAKCEWEGNHQPLSYLHKSCKSQNINPDDLHILAIVRNPWTKMFSTWRYFSTINFMEFYSGDESIDKDFNKWVKWIYTDFDRKKKDRGRLKWNMFKYHFSEQLNWLRDEEGNRGHVDKIWKTEELTGKMDEIAELYGWENVIVMANKTKNKNVPDFYEETYNQESIDLIAKHFAGDITEFNYDYEGG